MENNTKRRKPGPIDWFGSRKDNLILPLDVQYLVVDNVLLGVDLRAMAAVCRNWKECIELYMYHARPLMFPSGEQNIPFFVTAAKGFIIPPVPNNMIMQKDYRAPIICSKNAFLMLRTLRPIHILVGTQWLRYGRYSLCKFSESHVSNQWNVHTQTQRGLWSMVTFPLRIVSRTALSTIRLKMQGKSSGLARFCIRCGHVFNPSYKDPCTHCGHERTPAAIAYKSWQEF